MPSGASLLHTVVFEQLTQSGVTRLFYCEYFNIIEIKRSGHGFYTR